MQSMLRKGLSLTLKGLKQEGKNLPARIANQRAVASGSAGRLAQKGKVVAKRGILPKLKHTTRKVKQKVQLTKKAMTGKKALEPMSVAASNNQYVKQFENLTKNFKGKELEEGIKMLLVKMPMDEKYRKTIKHVATNVYGVKL